MKFLNKGLPGFFLCNFAALFLGVRVLATVTATPVLPYALSNSTVYYATTDVLASNMDTGFSRFDLNVHQGDATAASNAMYFDIAVTNATFSPTAGQQVVVSAWIVSDSSDLRSPVPIGYAGGAVCGTTSNCQGLTGAYYYAARFPGNVMTNTLRVGLIPGDLCALTGGATGNKCTGASGIPVTTGAIGIIFYVTTAANTTEVPAFSALGSEKSEISIRFQTGVPSYSCPAAMADTYFPSDGAILFEPAKIGFSASAAPHASVLIVAKKDGAVTTSTPASAISTSNNTVVERIPPARTASVGGFVNTTDGTDNNYQMAASVIDSAGVIAPFLTACVLSNVQTTDVQGFLNKGNCFIATATFNSYDGAPLKLLRTFRDRVLIGSQAGNEFVHWYYSWSPGAAAWLMERPLLRFPVMILLIPVQIFAWLSLNPFAFTFVLVFLLIAVGGGLLLTTQKEKKFE